MASRGGGVIGGRQNPTKIIVFLISVIKLVKYFGFVREGHGGALKSYKMIMAPPLSVIKIVTYCGVCGGVIGGCQNPTKDNGAPPPLSH